MRLVALLLLLTSVAVGARTVDAKQVEPSPLDDARADIAQLDDLLGDRAAPEGDVVAYVRIAAERHESAKGPAKDVEAFRRDVQDLLLVALSKSRVRGDQNQLEAVNVAAAKALAALGVTLDEKARSRLWKKVRKAVLALHDARGYEPSAECTEATFAALARTGTPETLGWLLEEYSHTKQHESRFLVAAHRAMVLFDDVNGKQRHEIVKRFVERYASVEALAEQSANTPANAAKRRLWDQIRTTTIAVVQKFAGFPGEDGVAYARMLDFQSWFRDHKDARRDPWA